MILILKGKSIKIIREENDTNETMLVVSFLLVSSDNPLENLRKNNIDFTIKKK